VTLTDTKTTKAELRAAARAESARIQAAQQAQEARNQRLIWGGLGGLLAALIAVFLLVAQPWNNRNAVPNFTPVPMEQVANTPANTTPEGGFLVTAGGGTASTVDPNLPTIDVYFDYMCPACLLFETVNLENMREFADSGEANVVLHPVAILNRFTPRTQFSTRAVSAAGWVASQSPANFLRFHELMFNNQPNEAAGGDMSNARMAELAIEAGVPAGVAAGIEDGTAMNTYGEWAVSLTQRAVSDPALVGPSGFGTPTVMLDGARWDGDWSDPGALPAAIATAGAAVGD
jgi:protein-disulfide isomerase